MMIEESNLKQFIAALSSTMEMMLGQSVEVGDMALQTDCRQYGDISAVIGFGGDNVTGVLSLRFEAPAALAVYEAMMGEAATELNEDVRDCIGEISNIVLGSAKTLFSEMNVDFLIAIPTIIVGRGHTVRTPAKLPVVDIHYSVLDHECLMEVGFLLGAN